MCEHVMQHPVIMTLEVSSSSMPYIKWDWCPWSLTTSIFLCCLGFSNVALFNSDKELKSSHLSIRSNPNARSLWYIYMQREDMPIEGHNYCTRRDYVKTRELDNIMTISFVIICLFSVFYIDSTLLVINKQIDRHRPREGWMDRTTIDSKKKK